MLRPLVPSAALVALLSACTAAPVEPEPLVESAEPVPDGAEPTPVEDPLDPTLLYPDGPSGLATFADAEPLTCGVGPADPSVTYGHSLVDPLECEDPLSCVAGYRTFLAMPELDVLAPEFDQCDDVLAGWLSDLVTLGSVEQPAPAPVGGEDVGRAIVEGTNTGFLFDPVRFAARRLHVVELSRRVETTILGDSYEVRQLVLHDPWVGQIHAEHVLPVGAVAPVPTIVILPGHDEQAADHRMARYGQFLPREGFATVTISFRAWNTAADTGTSAETLCRGIPLMMLRAYEAMLLMKFVQAAPESCGAPIGLLGHSGGSLTGNLLGWMPQNPALVHVSDLRSDHSGLRNDEHGEVAFDCEFHPRLNSLSGWINDFGHMPRPIYSVPYGYVPDGDSQDWQPLWDDLRAMEHFVPVFRHYLLGDTSL
jgi:hypothetical protein